MKWFILVIALSIFLELSLAKSSDKTYPKKVKNKKPTKSPKSILDEFSTVSEDDKEFIKELDKQFKMYGDMIKIKVERDNSTVKNPKRTIEGELGYGNQNILQQPRFQFGPAKFQLYPYSQQGIPPLPFSFNGNGFGFGQSAVQIQPSRAYEIKQTPTGYQTFAPNNSPFRPLFTTKPPPATQSYSPAPFPTAAYPTTKFPNTPPFISTPAPYTTTPSPFGTTINPLFTTVPPPFLNSPIQTPGFPSFQSPFQPAGLPIQQQYSEPVIVLKIPGPAKYASHLQALLQRYLEIRAAQYIKAFEDHEARVAQQQALFRSQPQTSYQQQQALHPLIQSTEFYKPATNYMVPTPGPTTELPPQEPQALVQQQNFQQQNFQPQNFQQQNFQQQNFEQQTVDITAPIRRPQTYATSQIQQPKQLAVQIENPDGSGYSFPKIQQQQQFIVQQVPVVPDPVQQSYRQPTPIFESKPAVPASQLPESVQAPADYLVEKPAQPESLGMYNQQSYSSPYGNKPYPEVDEQYQQQQQQQQQQQYDGPTRAPEQGASVQTTQKPSEFSLSNILRKQNFPSFAAYNSQQQQQANNGRVEEVDDQPEIPEARHQPTYSNQPIQDNVQRDEDQQLFSYDQAPQAPENQQSIQQPHKVYGPPAVDPAADTEAALPTQENSPRPTHTRIRFNENNNAQDHSSMYPLPPLPSSLPKFDYERQQQQQQQQGYETVENEYGTQEQVANIAEQQRSRDFNRYNSQSVLETDFQGDAPYTQSQFRKLNELINKLKQRSSPLQVQPLQTSASDQ